jgi:hypothetical protein
MPIAMEIKHFLILLYPRTGHLRNAAADFLDTRSINSIDDKNQINLISVVEHLVVAIDMSTIPRSWHQS